MRVTLLPDSLTNESPGGKLKKITGIPKLSKKKKFFLKISYSGFPYNSDIFVTE